MPFGFPILAVALVACDDPVPGPAGGVIFTIQVTPALCEAETEPAAGEVVMCHIPQGNPSNAHTITVDDSSVETHLDNGDTLGACACADPVADIDRVVVHTRKIKAEYSEAADGSTMRDVTIDTEERTIELLNVAGEVFVAQYEVPVGFLWSIRVFPDTVEVFRHDGTSVTLTGNPNLPSWNQSGWKFNVAEDAPIPVTVDELIGARGDFVFGDEVSFNARHGYRFDPTVLLEEFAVNPPPGEPGILLDQVTIVFRDHMTSTDIDALNAEIGATVAIAPQITNAWRMKLPPRVDVQEALRYYHDDSRVLAALPAVRLSLDFDEEHHDLINAPAAWDRLQSGGRPGLYTVRAGILDDGTDYTHPDLYLNIAINQGEIPVAFSRCTADFSATPACEEGCDLCDIDADGIISFRDLNSAENWPLKSCDVDNDDCTCGSDDVVCDINRNERIDGGDLIGDAACGDERCWANGNDEDDDGSLPDDIIGWDFEGGDNDPMPGAPVFDENGLVLFDGFSHGTITAGILGAMHNNIDVNGIAPIVSIPVVKYAEWTFGFDPRHPNLPGVDDVLALESIQYAELKHFDVANISAGWNVASKEADQSCAFPGQTTDKVRVEDFVDGFAEAQRIFEVPPFKDADGNVTSTTLYVFSAGNDHLNLDDPDIAATPKEPMKAALPDNVILVGAIELDGTVWNDGFFAGGSNYGDIVDVWAPGSEWIGLRTVAAGGGVWLDSNGDPDPLFGTSAAAPVVAGVAAMVIASDVVDQDGRPMVQGDPGEIKRRIVDSAAPVVDVSISCDGAPTFFSGTGRLVDLDAATSPW